MTLTKLRKHNHQGGGPRTKIAKLAYFANGVRAIDMRAQGMSWPEIAEILGFELPNSALKCARDARSKLEEESKEELRFIHHQRYEKMYKALVPKIDAGRERAIEVAAKVLENDAKLMGINEDEKGQTGEFQPILIQIRPAPDDPEAVRLARAKPVEGRVVGDNKPNLLPPPDTSA